MFTEHATQLAHPLIVCAGYDGTGLQALQRALALLGKPHSSFPIFQDAACKDFTEKACRISMEQQIHTVMLNGFQNASFPASHWQHTDAVLGHPVPLLVWDFLEAFPTAKVILTVRNVDELWDTVSSLSPTIAGKLWVPQLERMMKMYWWAMYARWQLNKRHFMRHYWRHNAKVIHGVPRAQLLIWNLYEEPAWARLCDFLGVPVPPVPFPAPDKTEF